MFNFKILCTCALIILLTVVILYPVYKILLPYWQKEQDKQLRQQAADSGAYMAPMYKHLAGALLADCLNSYDNDYLSKAVGKISAPMTVASGVKKNKMGGYTPVYRVTTLFVLPLNADLKQAGLNRSKDLFNRAINNKLNDPCFAESIFGQPVHARAKIISIVYKEGRLIIVMDLY